MDKTGYDTKLEKLGLSTIANYRKAYQIPIHGKE